MNSPILQDVNDAQRRAITHGPGPLLVIAGAGSGKTRVITRRIAHLLHNGVAPWEITALTFTNKAAREMRARVAAMVPAADLWVCTFHAFAARALRRWGEALGYTREFTIYDTEDRNNLIKTILKEKAIDGVRPAEVANDLSRMKNGMGRIEHHGFHAEMITKVMVAYDERMRAANAMDFDDLLVNLGRLLAEVDAARAGLQRRGTWLLVDEYQDTNKIQYDILQGLATGAKNVCATGDPDQSIYRWRGATIRNILDFEKDFDGASVITLDQNYRSTKSILAVANAVIRHNRDRYEKELVTANEEGERVREARCLDETDEAMAAARQALQWIEAGRRAGDIALFYRVNAQSRTIERGLRDLGVPYRIVGSVEFYKRKEVKDVLAYVRVARNPRDIASFLRIFNTPTRGLGKTTEQRLLDAAIDEGVMPRALLRDREGLARFARARKALTAFAQMLDEIEALDPTDPASFIETVITKTEYRKFLGEGTALAEADRIANVDELINAAAEYALREPAGGIDGFLEENALVSDQDTYDDQQDAVTLMTVHSAKGLEFPCVAVTGLEEQVFPHALSLDSPEEVEEERRLFYVAVTRARKELMLLHASSRMRYGAPTPSIPSRFLDEIPDDLLEVDHRGVDPFGGGRDDGFQDIVYDEEAAYRSDAPLFRAGERVRHQLFGTGRVVAVRSAGGATRVTVEFDNAGRKELSLEFANLQKL
ncbi:MAG: UvrD-helicase domain-containing protein [Planctomycetota bacterium]